MSLDKRLKDLCENYVDDKVDFSGYVEAIKQAFIDEGWIQSPRNTYQPRTVNVEQVGEKLYVVSGMDEVTTYDGKKISLSPAQPERLTGPEWLARFEKETAGQLFPYRNDREQELVASTAHFFNQAARRATGVDHD